jgi:hypothetical protein
MKDQNILDIKLSIFKELSLLFIVFIFLPIFFPRIIISIPFGWRIFETIIYIIIPISVVFLITSVIFYLKNEGNFSSNTRSYGIITLALFLGITFVSFYFYFPWN